MQTDTGRYLAAERAPHHVTRSVTYFGKFCCRSTLTPGADLAASNERAELPNF
jgi:hypothetical protein